jgi:glycosyltransferase involved in cell wall biosynthesis
MSTLQLCLAAQSYYPFYAGGALRFMRYLPGLRARGIETRVFTGTPDQAKNDASAVTAVWQNQSPGLLPVEQVNGSPVHRLWQPEDGARRRAYHYGRELARFCRQPEMRPDVVQLLPLPFWALPALLELRRAGVPLLYAYNLSKEAGGNRARQWGYRWLRRWQLGLMAGVVVNSSALGDELAALGVKTAVHFIPNGVDLQRFRPANSPAERLTIRQQLGIPADAPVAISVGAVEPRKGTDLLLAAWSHLATSCPQSHLIIVGPRHDLQDPALAAFGQKLATLAAAAHAPGRLHFVGRVENVAEYLRAADLFVFTSGREGLPNVMLEAMATRLPALTTTFTGLAPEMGRPGEQYSVAGREPEALAAQMDAFLSSPPLQHAFGAAARAWVEKEMDVERVLDRYVELYREIST